MATGILVFDFELFIGERYLVAGGCNTSPPSYQTCSAHRNGAYTELFSIGPDLLLIIYIRLTSLITSWM